jgi:hypothetical protein
MKVEEGRRKKGVVIGKGGEGGLGGGEGRG